MSEKYGKAGIAAAKERPILFRDEMVRAILDGRKTQTRRVAKPPREMVFLPGDRWTNDVDEPGSAYLDDGSGRLRIKCPHGQPGDRLWVRETFSDPFPLDIEHKNFTGFYRATDPDRKVKWKPSIFMPRWASRITLEITDVRVERLNTISEEDAIAEGIEGDAEGQWKHYLKPKFGPSPAHSYQTLWESINGGGSWAENPLVWVVNFRRVES